VSRARAIVVGGGPVGLAFACAAQAIDVHVLESAPGRIALPGDAFDLRVFALSPGTREFLRSLGAWERIAKERVAPVRRMEVRGDDGRSRLDFAAPPGGALAWIVEAGRLAQALEQSASAASIAITHGARARAARADAGGVEVELEDGATLAANLLVGADGPDSWVRRSLGMGVEEKSYGEAAVVANFRCERTSDGVARQWFRDDGVLAWLPLPGSRISIVWSVASSLAAELAALDADALAHRVRDAGGAALGDLAPDSPVATFPLRMLHVPAPVIAGAALIGDAAHGVHPLAGQGVNLGFQDARLLAQALASRSAVERPGDLRVLRRYARARREDVAAMQFVTDRLDWLFSHPSPGVATLRNTGMALVNSQPWARRAFAQRAMR
jgi:2-polyprenylphenol 6-hydroxylase